jgi:hypothetical protein
MARGPLLRIPSVAAPIKGSDAVDVARLLGAEAVDVDVVFSAASDAIARHGLGRKYLGAVVIGITAGHTSGFIAAATPETTRSNGYDPDTFILVKASAAYTGTVRLWVF